MKFVLQFTLLCCENSTRNTSEMINQTGVKVTSVTKALSKQTSAPAKD